MKLLSVEFVTSAAAGGSARGIPGDALPQIAIAGRSNVGKSSLLNALCRRKVARTSAAPGKTRLVNIYRIGAEGGPGGPGRWDAYLVDLAGYGYARGGPGAGVELARVAEAYFLGGRKDDRRTGLRPVLLLLDARHPGLDSDVRAHGWLREVAGPPHLVATKIDKLSRAERARNLKVVEDIFGTAALPVSAASGEGLDELWTLIAKLVRNRQAAPPQPNHSPS